MHLPSPLHIGLLLSAAPIAAATFTLPNPFERVKGSAEASDREALRVDLGYGIYEGVGNATTGVDTYRGIRFAAPPTGSLRWQAPAVPAVNRSAVLSASSFGPVCPGAGAGGKDLYLLPSADEDCLFLSVYAPKRNISELLPVVFWIHGGGFGMGDGSEDLTAFIQENDHGVVGVAIQYRLGAFGFLASDEVYRNGAVNAALLDQVLALQWVQTYIKQFGGDPQRVTIAGLSAGAASVMLLDIAYGGELGTSLFTNSISSSPAILQQYGYKDWIPTQNYYAFATAAGCPPQWAYGNSSQTIFECLVSKDTQTLQEASATASASGTFGAWAFIPVTDGALIQSTPSSALKQGKVNGVNHLTGNAAEEGYFFVEPNITTENDLRAWIDLVFPLFTPAETSELLALYPFNNLSATAPLFATDGDNEGLTAVDVSRTARGQQQRANTIYAETTFICPSYWLAEAYASPGHKGYKYQYSIVPAIHGSDTSAAFGRATPNQGPDFATAYSRIWGNFVKSGNPSISSDIAHGAHSNETSGTDGASGLADWPQYTATDRRMANLNQTGGTLGPVQTIDQYFHPTEMTAYLGPGLTNDLSIVDADQWEGGRGERCEFWKRVADSVPE